MEIHKVQHRIPPTQTQVMSATQTSQVMVSETEDCFTKREECYHHGQWGKWKGGGEGRTNEELVKLAKKEVLNNDTYIGFSHNTKTNSVYLIIKRKGGEGIKYENIRCERRPVPQALAATTTSQRWKWHSLYIKN